VRPLASAPAVRTAENGLFGVALAGAAAAKATSAAHNPNPATRRNKLTMVTP
jgi:hypothetical protein